MRVLLRTRGTVSDYYYAAFRKLGRGLEKCRAAGPLVWGCDRLCARFDLTISAGRLAKVGYRCATCVTLVALCEHIAELAAGQDLEQARTLTERDLIGLHPEIPPARHDRAALAVAAFHAALPAASTANNL